MRLPPGYLDRVYAGVLGKLIGVYLGRPLEGWTYERITAEVGEVSYYVNKRLGLPLVVTDDDISGAFTFVRALEENNYNRDLTATQIGRSWLNAVIEGRTTLWWGGMGAATEHTAFLRLQSGIEAPCSGSARLNGRVVAEQIGAQIFIDPWAMLAPGGPDLAADLARRAASVSHDGEAVYAAQFLAAMEAQAFVEADVQKLLEVGLEFIPEDSTLYRLVQDLRQWHAGEPDWHVTRARIEKDYGYDQYGGPCHVIPNHALILLSVLYGEGDFHRSLRIATTSGWDTDCNSGNVGCLLGIKSGLAAFEGGPDWRGPVADRLFVVSADGGRAVTDAATQAFYIANAGRALARLEPLVPKEDARFHFELPGSVQGFRLEADCLDVAALENVPGHSKLGRRSLAFRYKLEPERVARAASPTFITPEERAMPGYLLLASPTLYSGQVVKARLEAGPANDGLVTCRLYVGFDNYWNSKWTSALIIG